MLSGLGACSRGNADTGAGDDLARGRYLVVVGGCNECHTPGYAEAGGRLPEHRWLEGSPLGWTGPWGTTYPVNIRAFIADMTEDEWVKYARQAVTRPPMGWFVLNALTEPDARAVYRFIRHLGPSSNRVPDYMPPGDPPPAPTIRYPESSATKSTG
jgi:mono/diheme cytochrome c family protein